MSIENLATGDTVIKQTESASNGNAFGNAFTYTNGSSLDCLVQTVSARESLAYENREFAFSHQLFFYSDPGLTTKNRLKWTVEGGATLSTPKFLRVLASYKEGRPGGDMLWVVDCGEEPARFEE